VKRSAAAAVAVAVIALSGLSACTAKTTNNSIDDARTSAPKPSPTVVLPGIATISYCVGESTSHAAHAPVTIALYRGTQILGRKDTTVGTRVSIDIEAGSYDLVVSNVILQSGIAKDGQTVTGDTGRFCPAK
jgi:hypothetical protein